MTVKEHYRAESRRHCPMALQLSWWRARMSATWVDKSLRLLTSWEKQARLLRVSARRSRPTASCSIRKAIRTCSWSFRAVKRWPCWRPGQSRSLSLAATSNRLILDASLTSMCMSLCRGRESAFVSLNTWWNTRAYLHTSTPMINPRQSCSASYASTSIWHHIRPRPTTLSSLTSTLEEVAHQRHLVRETTRGSKRRLATTTTTLVATNFLKRNKSTGVAGRINLKAFKNRSALVRDSVRQLKNRKNAKLCGHHRQLSLSSNMKRRRRLGQQRKTNPRFTSMSHLNINSNNHAPISTRTLGDWEDRLDQQTYYWLSIIQLFL